MNCKPKTSHFASICDVLGIDFHVYHVYLQVASGSYEAVGRVEVIGKTSPSDALELYGQREDAEAARAEMREWPETDVSRVRSVIIPAGVTDPDEITAWLDECPELWEPDRR